MVRHAIVWILLAALPGVIAASQSRPNFNGRWVAVEPATVAGHELVIVQNGSTLKLEQVRIRSQETYDSLGRRVDPAGQRESTLYRLDGEVTVTGRASETVRSSLIELPDAFVLRDTYHAVRLRFERRLDQWRYRSMAFRGRISHLLPGNAGSRLAHSTASSFEATSMM